jgi:hypothetical protein
MTLFGGSFSISGKESVLASNHNIEFYSQLGRECYLMAAVGKRERIMKLMAAGFSQYLFHLANLHQHLRESRYLIKPVN